MAGLAVMSSRAAIAARRGLLGIMAQPSLFQPHVLGEVVVLAAFAGEAPAHRLAGVAAGEHVGQEALLRRPAGLRLRFAVAARHGVVQPAVGSALIDVDVVALAMLLQAIAQAPHIGERDDMIGLAESPEYRAA